MLEQITNWYEFGAHAVRWRSDVAVCLSRYVSVCHVDALCPNDLVDHYATFTILCRSHSSFLRAKYKPNSSGDFPHLGRQIGEGGVKVAKSGQSGVGRFVSDRHGVYIANKLMLAMRLLRTNSKMKQANATAIIINDHHHHEGLLSVMTGDAAGGADVESNDKKDTCDSAVTVVCNNLLPELSVKCRHVLLNPAQIIQKLLCRLINSQAVNGQ